VGASREPHHLFDLPTFGIDHHVIFRKTVELGHGRACAGRIVVVEVVTGGFGEEDDADAEDRGPDPADAHGDAVGAGVVAGFGSVVYAVCREDADGDEELVAAGKVKV
jgi:hypothetical protein